MYQYQRWHTQYQPVRMPGVEPGSQAWEACMIPLHYMRAAHPPLEYGRAQTNTLQSPQLALSKLLGATAFHFKAVGASGPAGADDLTGKARRRPGCPRGSCHADAAALAHGAARKTGAVPTTTCPIHGWGPSHPEVAHAGSRARVTSMGGLYDTATLHALCTSPARLWASAHKYTAEPAAGIVKAPRGHSLPLQGCGCFRASRGRRPDR